MEWCLVMLRVIVFLSNVFRNALNSLTHLKNPEMPQEQNMQGRIEIGYGICTEFRLFPVLPSGHPSPYCPLFFPVIGRIMCEIRDGSVNHTSCKALIKEPFLLLNAYCMWI